MADEKIVTSIVANSDFSNLIADVQRVTASLSRLQQEFAGSNRSLAGQIDATNAMFSETMRKTGQFSTHFVSLTSDVEKFGRNLDSGRLKLKDYFRVYQDHTKTTGGLIRDLAKQQVQLQNAVLQPLGRNAQGLMQYNVHIPRGLDLTKNKTSILKQELQIMNKVIQDGGVQLINWGKNTQWAGRQLTVGLTLPIMAFGKAAADAFKVADQELTRLTKVYGDVAGTSAQELGQIRKEVSSTAKELSAAMGVNFAETISLAADIAATGKTGNELLGSLTETTRLAVLGEVDRAEAMKATLAIQTAFKQNTEELSESINFLNAVENQTSTTLNDLVTAIPKAGPVVKSLGGNIQDLALYLTAMREGGINASEGANALKSGLASLINPTKQSVGVLRDFGIDILGLVNKNAGNTTGMLLDLQAALDSIDPFKKAQAIEQLFGKFQFARISALLSNLGKEGSQTLQVLDLMKASAGELEAVAGRELTAVTESAAGRYKRALETLKAELAGVGDQFLNIGTKLVNVLSKILEFAQKLPDPIKKIMAFGGAFTAIIGPVIMLTGVLANFFGYIIKGLGHFKALFKGAEGFKLLTPEIMAAKAAGSQLANEFYSDALAADTLRIAISKLSNDLVLLQKNALGVAKPGSATGQLISTIAGSPLMTVGGGARITDPNHPLVGTQSRAAAHLNPRDPNNPSSIFGLTLQPIPLNRKIGRTPQVMMTEALPNIEGVTSHQGYSTGVVAGEHARYAALMATLGVQSRQEIEALKKTIALGGQVSSEFISTFDDILPITRRLTQNAATQSASIVAQLRAGQLSAEQARAAIIAVNADLERMMGSEVSLYAASRGRTIDLSKAPLINQPVVDASGKPNTRGMFRQGIFSDVMGAVGRATGTRTFGGPYSIETTRPSGLIIPRRNAGGPIFYNNGDQVPGPNINADVVPAMLTPGEFVIRRDVAQQDPDGMRALNEGRATVVPFNANSGGKVPGVQYRLLGGGIVSLLRQLHASRSAVSGAMSLRNVPRGGASRSARQIFESRGSNFQRISRTGGGGERGRYWSDLLDRGIITKAEYDQAISTISTIGQGRFVTAHAMPPSFLRRFGGSGSGTDYPEMRIGDIPSNIPGVSIGSRVLSREAQDMARLTPSSYVTMPEFGGSQGVLQGYHMGSLGEFLLKTNLPAPLIRKILNSAAMRMNQGNYSNKTDARVLYKDLAKAEAQALMDHADEIEAALSIPFAANRGGKIRRFNRGGMIPGYNGGGKLSRASLLAKLGAKFNFTGKHYSGPQALETYSIKAMDMNGGRKYFGDLPISDKARGALYNSTVDFFNSNVIRPDRGAPEQRGFGVRHLTTAFPTIASMALNAGKDFLTKDDITLLSSYAGKSGSLRGSMGASLALHRVAKVFRANQGGSVPRYMSGGSVPRYGYARGVQNRFAGGGILRMLAAMGIMQAGMGAGQKMGGAGGQALSMASSFLPFMFMGMGPGTGPLEDKPTAAQRLGMSGPIGSASGYGQTLASQMNLTPSTSTSVSAMRQSIFATSTPLLGRFAGSVEKAASSTSRLQSSLGKLGLAATRFNVVLAISVAAGIKLFDVYKDAKRSAELFANSFGLTEDAAEKAGLKYTDYRKTIKDSVDAQKLFITQNKLTYESMVSANTPFRMTISEYKKLRKEVKGSMSDQIETLTAASNTDVNRLVVQLKEQLVAAGLSAEEASKRIYAMLQLSNKSGLTVSAMSSERFRAIKDPSTAALSALDTFGFARDANPKMGEITGELNAFNNAMMAIDNAVETSFQKSKKSSEKKKKDFDETLELYNAEKQQLDIISSKMSNQIEIGDELLFILQEQNPELAKFLNNQDTIVSTWQKIRLATRGYTGDLERLSVQQAALAYQLSTEIARAVQLENQNGLLKNQYKEYNRLKDLQKSMQSAAKGQSVKEQIDARDAIKAIDKKIKKINEEADARKKALQEEAQAEDHALKVKEARLEYERRVSAGDLDGSAEAYLALQRAGNDQELFLTEKAIEDRRKKDVAPLEKEKERLEKANQDLADKAALAADSLESVNGKLQKQKEKIDKVNEAMSSLKLAVELNEKDLEAYKTTEQFKGLVANFTSAVAAVGITVPTDSNKVSYTKDGGLVVGGSPFGDAALNLIEKSLPNLTTILAQKDINITGTSIKIDGATLNIGSGSAGNPFFAGDASKFINPINLKGFSNTFGTNSVSQLVKQIAENKGYEKGQFFELADEQGQLYKFRVRPDGGISLVTNPYKKAGGGYIKGYSTGSGGAISGPGTSTSDSIPAYLSDGEYVVRASAVDHYGVDTFDAMNAKKLANGGSVGGGYKNSGAPHEMGMRNQVPVHKPKLPFEWSSYKGNNSFLKNMDTSFLGGFRGLYNFLARPLIYSAGRMLNPNSKAGLKDNLYDSLTLGSLGLLPKARAVGSTASEMVSRASGLIPKTFTEADIGVLKRYVERPLLNADDMAWILDKGEFGKYSGTFFRALSDMDMATIAGYVRVPNPNLAFGKEYMDRFFNPSNPSTFGFGDMTMPARWSIHAAKWKEGTVELFNRIFKNQSEWPVYGSEAALPYMDLVPPMQIGQIWRPEALKSITKELEFAKEIAAFGGTGGGLTKAIAKIIVDPKVQGLPDFRSLIPTHNASWRNPEYTEGAIAPFTKYVLEAINKNKYNIKDKSDEVSHLIDEYVFRATETAPYGQFLGRPNSNLLGIPNRYRDSLPIVKKKDGGHIKGYSLGGKVAKWLAKNVGPKLSGFKGGVDKTVEGLMRYLGMKDDPFNAFESQFKDVPTGIADGQLLRESLGKAIDNATRNKNILPLNIDGQPSLPISAKQSAYIAKQYKDLAKYFERSSKKYKKSEVTVESFNENLKSAKELMGSVDESRLSKDLNEFLENIDPSDFKKPFSAIDKEFFNIVKNPQEGIPGDKFGNLNPTDLFGPINAPEGISMSDYYAGKALENRLIASVYKDIAKIAKENPDLAVRLGLISPRPKYAYGGYVSKFHKGGKVGHKHGVLNKIDSALGGLADKENWEETANFFALPEIGRTFSDLFKYGNPVSMTAARLSGAEMRSSLGDNTISALMGIPYSKIPGVNTAISAAGRKFSTFGVDADRAIASAFKAGSPMFKKVKAVGQDVVNDFKKPNPAMGGSSVKGILEQGESDAKDFLYPKLEILNKAGIPATIDNKVVVDYLRRRKTLKGMGIAPTLEDLIASMPHIPKQFIEEVANLTSKMGLQNTSRLVPEMRDPETLLRPMLGTHAEHMRIVNDPDTFARYYEKMSHPLLGTRQGYLEIFSELFGSKLAHKVGIPAPKNTLGFPYGDIFTPAIYSEDIAKQGFETVAARNSFMGAHFYRMDPKRKGDFGSMLEKASAEKLDAITRSGYVLPKADILQSQLAEDVGALAAFVSMIRSSDTFTNTGNMMMSKVGSRLGALDFGFSFDKKGSIFPELLTKPEQILKIRDNHFYQLLNKASFGKVLADNRLLTISDGAIPALSDEEFLKNAYRGIHGVASKVGDVSVVKEIIEKVLAEMSVARPDIDIRLALEMAEQMAGLVSTFKGFSLGKFADGGYVNPSYSANMSVPSYKTGVKYLYDDTIAQLHKGEAVIPEHMNPFNPNADSPIGGTRYYIQPTINAAPGMDEMALARMATDMTLRALETVSVKTGTPRNISRRSTL